MRPLPHRLFAANTEAMTEIDASHREFAAAGAAAPPPAVGWPEELLPSEAAAPTDTVIAPDETALAGPAEPRAAHEVPPGPMLVVDPPALAPTEQAAASWPEDAEPVAARRATEQARRRRLGAPLPNLPITILVPVLVNLGLVAWRADIVRLVPQTASFFGAIGLPVNLRGP